MATAQPTPGTTAGADPTLGALVHDMTQQMSTLVRHEIRLAQAEMTQKGKRVAAAGIAALQGRSNVAKATPVKPEEALDGLKEDVATAKGEHRP